MISEVTPVIIDDWIDYLKDLPRTDRRKTFEHEFNLLSGILKFYAEFDDSFKNPIRPRHRKNIRVQSYSGVQNKHLNPEDFLKFHSELLKGKNGDLFGTMARVQFFQALRVSEVAALHWEDIKWNNNQAGRSEIHVSKSVFFSRSKNQEPSLQNSFKNSRSNNGLKVAPLLKDSYEALVQYRKKNETQGLIFLLNGKLLTYRQIQNAYDSAFKRSDWKEQG